MLTPLVPQFWGCLLWPLLLTRPLRGWARGDRPRSSSWAGQSAVLCCGLGPPAEGADWERGLTAFAHLPPLLPDVGLEFSRTSWQLVTEYLSIYFVTNSPLTMWHPVGHLSLGFGFFFCEKRDLEEIDPMVSSSPKINNLKCFIFITCFKMHYSWNPYDYNSTFTCEENEC